MKDVNIKEALAVGSGFGYYSLSSIIITKFHGETLGVIALIGVADLTIGYHLNSPGIKLIGLAASAGALVISPLFGLVYYHQTIDTNKAKKYIDRKKGKIA